MKCANDMHHHKQLTCYKVMGKYSLQSIIIQTKNVNLNSGFLITRVTFTKEKSTRKERLMDWG